MKKLILFSFLIWSGLLLSGCGGVKVTDDNSGLVRPACTGPGCSDVPVSKATQVAGVARQRQIFNSLQTCLKLPDASVSATTKATYAKMNANFSSEGKVDDINSPMVLSLTQLSADFCQDRINYEIAQKPSEKFFVAFNLAGAANDFSSPLFADILGDSVKAIAKSCWGRSPTAAETNMVRSQFASSQIGQYRDASAALFMCTLILSSPEVIIY